MVEVKRALAMTRLLTLTGAGGSGKTRLALEVARDLVGAYPDGVWLVELAPLSEGGLVPQAVAERSGVPEQPGRAAHRDARRRLARQGDAAGDGQLRAPGGAAARLVDALLDSCPRLRILATSREPLGVAGEVNWPVTLPLGTGRNRPLPSRTVRGPRGCAGCSRRVPRIRRQNFSADAGERGGRGEHLPQARRHPSGHRAGRREGWCVVGAADCAEAR